MRAMICTKSEQNPEVKSCMTYLGNHFKPCVYFDCAEPAGDRMANLVLGPEFEPKC